MANWKDIVETLVYIALVFFFIPIKYNDITEDELQFKQYLLDFNKTYNNETVYNLRLQAFKNSLVAIDFFNNNNNSAIYGLTKYSDMLPEEFLQNHLTPNIAKRILQRTLLIDDNTESSSEAMRSRRETKNLPEKVDWRNKNVVTKVKDQRNCGACWAFSTIETVESMNAIKTGKLQELSVQQIIDCASTNEGCNGGDICSLLTWMKTEQIKIETEQNYPLKLTNNKCKHVNNTIDIQISEFACENLVQNEDVILELLARIGPVAVAINAQTWQNYIGGTIQFHCNSNSSQLNHAVQLVGYDLTAPVPFYIARNTWGPDFGENGYLKLAVGKNICGLAYEVSALQT